MSNGRLSASALATIPGTAQQVSADLVAQTAALRAAFAARFGKPLTITDSYRPYAVQERIFRQRYTTSRVTGIDPRRWLGQTWWRLPGTAAAAVPGTSNHGWGQAIDFGSGVNVGGSPEQRWMAEHAPRFGWSWPTWARRSPTYEPWHYEAVAVPVSNYRTFLAGLGVTVPDLTAPAPLTPEDDLDDNQAHQLANVYAAMFTGGPDTPGGKSVLALLDDLRQRPTAALTAEQDHMLRNVYAAIFTGGESTPEGKSLLALAAEGRNPATVVRDLDDDALAALAAQVADLPRLVTDEQDRRARERLA